MRGPCQKRKPARWVCGTGALGSLWGGWIRDRFIIGTIRMASAVLILCCGFSRLIAFLCVGIVQQLTDVEDNGLLLVEISVMSQLDVGMAELQACSKDACLLGDLTAKLLAQRVNWVSCV